jgi:hypothetical protein
VPDVDKGTVTAATDTAPPAAAESPLAGFSEALLTSGMMGNPVGGESGHPENAKAVETSGDAEAPAVETEKPAATPEPVATEDKPEPAQTVNFDGFSDLQRTTWERLLKAGHATTDEVEAARKDALRQDLFSKKTAALARDREAFAKSMAEREGDLKLLDKIRGDDRLHAAWLKASRGELPTDDSDGGDLVDAKKAAEIADARLAQREREREERGVKEQAAYDARKGAMRTALREQMRLLGVSNEQMTAYLKAEEATLPPDVDPILALDPAELQHRVELRHEAAKAKAEAASLREQLSKRTAKEIQTSKQSLPPARRVAESAHTSPLKRTEADLGIAPDWSNVEGFGFRGAH